MLEIMPKRISEEGEAAKSMNYFSELYNRS